VPAGTIWLGGLAESEKFPEVAALTVRPAVTERVSPLLVPVTVMLKLLVVFTEPVFTVRVVELPALMEVEPKLQVSGEGQLLTLRGLTVPVNPFSAFAVMVYVASVPAVTV
jgi:hypothetical protein